MRTGRRGYQAGYPQALAVLAFTAAACVSAAPPANLVANPGFERSGSGWTAYGTGYVIDRQERHSGDASIRCSNATASVQSGATCTIELNQKEPAPIIVTAWSRCDGVGGSPDADYSVYVDLLYSDGTPLWGQVAPFAVGTHDWQSRRVLVAPAKPVKRAVINLLLRSHQGTAWFDDVSASELKGSNVFDSRQLPAPVLPVGSNSGWFVADVTAGSGPVLVANAGGRSTPGAGRAGVAFIGGPPGLGGKLLRGRIVDLTGKPRALTVYYVERLPAGACTWWQDWRRRSPVGTVGERNNLVRVPVGAVGAMSLYPFGCVTTARTGRALGVPVGQSPLAVRIASHGGGGLFYVAFDVCLSPTAQATLDRAGRSGADLSVVRYSVDPAWGFRSAAARYYSLFPEAFRRRAVAEGLWIPFADPSVVKGLEDFGIAYHEGDNSVASDDRLGILSFRYTEPMTYWMSMGKDAPREYGTAVRMVREQAVGADRGAREMAQAVLNSGARGSDGRFVVDFVNAPWTNGAVWTLNPNPALPASPTAPTKGSLSYTPGYGARTFRTTFPDGLDGEYLDSLEGWADKLDYGEGSLRAAPTLSFATDSLEPVVPEWFSVYELTRMMSGDLHRRGRLLMANATPWRIHWFAPYLDVMGTETNWMPDGQWRPDSDEVFCMRRVLSNQKPYLLLQNTDFDKFGHAEVERYFQRSMHYGVFPSMFSVDASSRNYWTEAPWHNRDRDLFRKYIPAIKRLSAAGWQPITDAWTDRADVYVERYGERYLTLLNDSAEPRTVRVRLGRFFHAGTGRCIARNIVTQAQFDVSGGCFVATLASGEGAALSIMQVNSK